MAISELYYLTKGSRLPAPVLVKAMPKRQRYVSTGPVSDTKLDRINAQLSEQNLLLHPTKGFRRFTFRRARLAALVQTIKSGKPAPGQRRGGWDHDAIYDVITGGF